MHFLHFCNFFLILLFLLDNKPWTVFLVEHTCLAHALTTSEYAGVLDLLWLIFKPHLHLKKMCNPSKIGLLFLVCINL